MPREDACAKYARDLFNDLEVRLKEQREEIMGLFRPLHRQQRLRLEQQSITPKLSDVEPFQVSEQIIRPAGRQIRPSFY